MEEAEDVCRLCLGAPAAAPIFVSSLAAKIRYCCGLAPHPADGLPAAICERCVTTLHLAASFKSQCERSDLILRQKLGLEPDPHDHHRQPDCQLETDSNHDDNLPYSFFMNTTPPQDEHGNYIDNEEFDNAPLETEMEIQKSEKKGHSCHLCNKILTRRYDLKRHIFLMHTKVEDSKCNICGETVEAENYAEHLNSHSDLKPRYECDICESKYFERRAFVMHLETAVHREAALKYPDRVKDYKCEKCNLVFSHRAFLDQHVRQLCNDYAKCTMCDKKFYNRAKHLRKCEKIIELKKQSSGKVDSPSADLAIRLTKLRHLERCDAPRYCALCFTPFRERSELTLHLKSHPNVKPCHFCYQIFNNSVELNRHFETKHRSASDVRCIVCKEFVSDRVLLKHLELHYEQNKNIKERVKKHHCDDCKKSFSKRRFLVLHNKTQRHQMISSKKLICNLCDAEFKHISRYRAHRRNCIL